MPVPKHVFTFETAAQLEPGTIMCVNRPVDTRVLVEGGVARDAKVITREARRSTPIWKSAEANVVISTNSLCMITALTIQEGVGVHADLVCFERSGERYNAVLLEAVDLDHGNNYFQFFDKSKFVFNLNRVYESIEKVNMFQNIEKSQVKRLHAGRDALDLDVNNCIEMWNFLAGAANLDINGNVHGVNLDVYAEYAKDESRKINLPEAPPAGDTHMAQANPYTITTRWSVRNFFRHKQWNLPPSEWLGAPKEQHVEEHVPRDWLRIPERDRWPIQRVVRDERGWCIAHGIPGVPMMNIERESNVDTHENWFAYGNFQQWWFHLTPNQRLLLWEKRGGSTEWEPPEDFEG